MGTSEERHEGRDGGEWWWWWWWGSDCWVGGGWLPTDWISITSIIMKGFNSGCWTKPGKLGQVCVGWTACVFGQIRSMCSWLIRGELAEHFAEVSSFFFSCQHFSVSHSIPLSLSFRGCSSSETESEAGDLLDQQFEELNNKLNSVTDPTGFLRMVSRNNLFNRYEIFFVQITSTFLRSRWETTAINKRYLDPLFHKKKKKKD